MNATKTTRRIGTETVTFTVTPKATRFGTLWTADNSLGEPKMTEKAFRTAAEALANEIAEVTRMLS